MYGVLITRIRIALGCYSFNRDLPSLEMVEQEENTVWKVGQ